MTLAAVGNKVLLDTGAAISNAKTNPHDDGPAYAVLPEGYKVEYLARPEQPVRIKGTPSFHDAGSFILYFNTFGAYGRIYASLETRTFIAVLNDHTAVDEPNWRDFTATYALKHSKEWQEWIGRNRQDFAGNDAFAVWLEDNAPDMVEPSAAAMMDIAVNMRVSQIQGFSKAVRLSDGNVRFTYSNDVSGSAGDLTIPETFTISIPVFEGLMAQKYTVEARFRYRLHNGDLKVRYELVRPHKVIENAFSAVIDKVAEETGDTVFFGHP